MKNFRALVTGWLLPAALCAVTAASAQTGGGYDLSWHTVDGGGVTFATGGGYSLGGTAGQPDAGSHTGAAFTLSGGFWFGATTAFTVVKDFSDGNTAAVTVTLLCSEGVVSPPSALASEATPASFEVTGFIGAPTCTATESVPPGYTANETGCAGVALTAGTCTIVNTLKVAAFSVAKDFSDNNPAAVTVSLACTSGVVSPVSALASESVPASFTVSGYDGTPSCTATETVPAGYTANQSGCSGVALATGACTIVNTLNAGSFTVAKDFSDNNPAAVTVSLSCTSGTVSPPSALASEAASAMFSVTGFDGAPNCTATETVPPGYSANQAGCAGVALATGTCTIVNAAIPGTISIVLTTVPSPDPDGTQFTFTAGGGLVPTSFTLSSGGVQTFTNVAPGSGYSVAPGIPSGWRLTSATCSDGSSPSNIDVSRDESVTCTFVISRALDIPALDRSGLLLLMCGLLALALFALRRRKGRVAANPE